MRYKKSWHRKRENFTATKPSFCPCTIVTDENGEGLYNYLFTITGGGGKFENATSTLHLEQYFTRASPMGP